MKERRRKRRRKTTAAASDSCILFSGMDSINTALKNTPYLLRKTVWRPSPTQLYMVVPKAADQAPDEPEPLTLRDILKLEQPVQPLSSPREDDAHGIQIPAAGGSAVPDHVCDCCVVLPPGGSDQLASSEGIHECQLEDDHVQEEGEDWNSSLSNDIRMCDLSEPGQSTVKVLTEALGSKPKTAVASAELLELEELMHDFELEYGKMHLAGGYSTDDGASSSQEGTRHLQHAMHATYAELYNAVPLDMVFRMKAAMQEIPEV